MQQDSKCLEKSYIGDMPTKKEGKELRAAFFKKPRQRENFFVVEGERAFSELVKSGWRILKVYSDSKNLPRVRRLIPPSISLEEVASKTLAELAQTETPPGVLALVEKRIFKLEDLAEESRILILDNLRDPGNAGTLLRSVRSLGWNGAILLKGTVELFSPKVVRSTAGALFHLKIAAEVSTEEALKFLSKHGFSLWVADSHRGVSPEDGRGLINQTPTKKRRGAPSGAPG
jgi:TrmH family RNA methyltransferase